MKDEEVPEQFFPVGMVVTNPDVAHLSPDQQEVVKTLLDPQLVRETPGFTSLVRHKFRLKVDAPVH